MADKARMHQYIPTTRAGSCIPANILLQILEQGRKRRDAEIQAWATTAGKFFWGALLVFLVFALIRTR